MPRERINSPDYEVPIEGFSHMVATQPGSRLIFVSGLTSRAADGSIVGVGDAVAQMRQVFLNLQSVLEVAGAGLGDVASIRTYVTNIGEWSRLEPIWREFWGDVWPASTLVEISRLFDERQMIELEATVALGPAKADGHA